MITREEFAIMQQQMVDMNNEKLNMMAQIDSLKQSVAQIDIIKKMMSDIRLSIEKESTSFKEEESKITSKINDQKKNLEEPSKIKSWDSMNLSRLENSYQKSQSKIVEQDDTIKELQRQIEESQLKQNELKEKIKKVYYVYKNNANIMKKVESFATIQLKVSEYESKLYSIQHIRKKNNKRISSMELSKTNIGKSNDILQEKYDILVQQLSEILTSIDSLGPDSEQSQSELSLLQNKENSIQTEIEQINSEDQKKKAEFTELFNKKINEKNALSDSLNQQNERNVQLSQSISQFSIDNSILINKKKSLIKQLNKSIKDKINDITQSVSSSPQVLQLVNQQEKHWVEKQQLYEIYHKVEEKHKELTDLVARKSIIADELKDFMKTVPPLDPKTASNPLAMLENAYQTALEENRARAANISDISQVLNEIKSENAELKKSV